MRKEEFSFLSSDGVTNIRAIRYIPEDKPKAILQISHGMVEFIDRYELLAKYLTDRGILVTGNDHLGHGSSVTSEDNWGYFHEDEGYLKVLEDLHHLTLITKDLYPNIPYFLLGHSMGSFYARRYLFTYKNELDGAIIMGTAWQPKIAVKTGKLLCNIIKTFKGSKYRSSLVNNMALGSYNKKWEPSTTHNDWLTKDEKIVEWYSNEPKCSFMFTVNGYYNVFSVLDDVCDESNIDKVEKDLPIIFLAGNDDPVGNYGKGVTKAFETFKSKGIKDVSIKLYPTDRHEILNELDKEQVYEDVYNFIDKHM